MATPAMHCEQLVHHTHTHRYRDRDRDRQTDRERQTKRQTDRQTDRHTDLVTVSVGQLDCEMSMNWTELQLGIGHDAIGIERLPWFVEPYPVVWPPQSVV